MSFWWVPSALSEICCGCGWTPQLGFEEDEKEDGGYLEMDDGFPDDSDVRIFFLSLSLSFTTHMMNMYAYIHTDNPILKLLSMKFKISSTCHVASNQINTMALAL